MKHPIPLTCSALLLALTSSAFAQTPDTTPPSVPANLAGTAVSSTSTVLYWTQSDDNTAVTAYDIHRDGVFLRTHSDNTFTDAGLAPGSAHIYRIAARDAAGNVSALSDSFTVTTDAAENPRLVRPAHLAYLGAFRFPGDDHNNYAYGGTAIGFNPAHNSLFARGHDWYQLVGEISIPTPVITSDFDALPVAAVLQNQADITEGHLNEVGAGGGVMDGGVIGGLLVHEGRLIGTSYIYYDAGGEAQRSHFTSGLNLARTGDFQGMYRVGTWNPGFVAGHMAHIPPEWQAALGGPVLTGLDGVPIVGRTSFGPTVSVFDPAQLGLTSPTPATLLVGYTSEHTTLGTWGNSSEPNPAFNQASATSGVVFPFGSDSVLFFGSSGTGIPGYGAGTSNRALDRQPVPGEPGVSYIYDPVNDAKGTHAYPYVAYAWAYRAADLARVVAGQLQPWQVVPYATWEIPLPMGTDGADHLCGAAYDPATQRIFVSQYNAVDASPIIHVYRVDLPTTPPPATYATWRAAGFGADAGNNAIAGPNADPDRCGLTNFARYAFDLPARGPVANPVTLGTADTTAGRVLTLTFPRRATASDLSYVVERSTDLTFWSTVSTIAPGTPASVTFSDAVPAGDVSRRFLRVRVTTP